MKKSGVFLAAILLIAFSASTSAAQIDDVVDQLQRGTNYAAEFETGNRNYAQFLFELSSAEEELNYNLFPRTQETLTIEELSQALGEPESSFWALSWDGEDEFILEEPLPLWKNKIVFDGNIIQLKVTVYPIQLADGAIIYQGDFTTVFKEPVSTQDVQLELSDVSELVKIYALNPDLAVANDLAQEATFLEKLFEVYFEKTNLKCDQVMDLFVGAENKKTTESRSTKDYLFHDDGEYAIKASLEISDDYEGLDVDWFSLSFQFERNGVPVTFFIDQIDKDKFRAIETKEGIKAAILELNQNMKQNLASGEYLRAYANGKEMQVATQVLNDRINSEQDPVGSFITTLSFYRSLLDGYELIGTGYAKKNTYEMTLYRDYDEEGEEMCMNGIDDTNDGKIDCADSVCAGEVCGYQEEIIEDGNGTTAIQIPLYCVEGVCQEKPKDQKAPSTANETNESICGDNICATDEAGVCFEDCPVCETFDPIECRGQVISGGIDVYGCPKEPICIEDPLYCETNIDCTKPLCGDVSCVENRCVPTEFSQCSQKQCEDGQKEFLTCPSGEKIVKRTCSKGVWRLTGLSCPTISAQDAPESTLEVTRTFSSTPTSKIKTCATKADCATGETCLLGASGTLQCQALTQNTYTKVAVTKEAIVTGTTFTGKAVSIDLTGEAITGTGITSAVGPGGEEFLAPPDPSTVTQRTYEEIDQSKVRFTGITRDDESEVEVTVGFETSLPTSEKVLKQGVANEFVLQGECIDRGTDEELSVVFRAGGTLFDDVVPLLDSYREEGPACDLELKKQVRKRGAIEESFNDEFAEWFYYNLANDASNWATQKQKVYNMYQEITRNLADTAHAMECSGVRQVDFNPLFINYQSIDGSFTLNYYETIQDTRIPGMTRRVLLPNPRMEASLFLDREILKELLQTAMTAHEFPSSTQEREFYGGLTQAEMQKLREETELQNLMISMAREYVDGYFDFQMVIEDEGETVYNIVGRVGEEGKLRFAAMNPEEVPPVDAKITLGYNELYELLKSSESKKTYVLDSPFENNQLGITQRFNSFFDWIDIRLKSGRLMNSIQVNPASKETQSKQLFEQMLFLLGD